MSRAEEDLKTFYASEMKHRAARPLGEERTARVTAFAEQLRAARASTLLEVGCGAGRDGLVLSGSGCTYTGVDLSAAAVQICRDQGLHALEASATTLPFADDSFDAAWSMSTLMHLPGPGFDQDVVAFETWDWFDDGGHYQFARVVAR